MSSSSQEVDSFEEEEEEEEEVDPSVYAAPAAAAASVEEDDDDDDDDNDDNGIAQMSQSDDDEDLFPSSPPTRAQVEKAGTLSASADPVAKFLAEMSHMSEVDRYRALSAYLEKNKDGTQQTPPLPPPSPPPPAKKEKKSSPSMPPPAAIKDVVPKKKKPTQDALPYFPHARDLERAGFYVQYMAWDFSATGTTGSGEMVQLDDNDDNDPGLQQLAERTYYDSAVFFLRFSVFRSQLLAAFRERCAQNGPMTQILAVIDRCKLVTFNQAKQLDPEQVPYCVWSGKEITPPESARSMALIPICKSWSHSANEKVQGELEAPIAFHVDPLYLDVFKCLHTLLFFIDYVHLEISNKLGGTGKNAVPTPTARQVFLPDMKDKKNIYTALILSARKQLRDCVSVMRAAIENDAAFLVKTPPQGQGGSEDENGGGGEDEGYEFEEEE